MERLAARDMKDKRDRRGEGSGNAARFRAAARPQAANGYGDGVCGIQGRVLERKWERWPPEIPGTPGIPGYEAWSRAAGLSELSE